MKRFDEIVTDIPIGSGPYRIGPVAFGRDITYVRDPQYWGRDLNGGPGAFTSTASRSRSTRTILPGWRP